MELDIKPEVEVDQQQGTSSTKFSRFSNDGVFLRSAHLTLEYHEDKPFFKSIGKATGQLAKMGLHKRGDGHFLSIEEALYLSEIGAAIVLDREGNNPLAIAQLFALLARSNISILKYAVFAQLVRAGYVVRPAGNGRVKEEEKHETFGYSVRVRTFKFSKEQLDQFPCIYSQGAPGPFSLRLHLPQIVLASSGTSLFVSGCDEQRIQLDFLNERLAKRVKQNESKLLFNLRRFDRDPWECLRPRYWPSFQQLRSCENWKSYEIKRKALLENWSCRRRGGRRFDGRQQQQRRSREQEMATQKQRDEPAGYDYDLFDGVGRAAQLLYRVLVIDGRFPPGRPNFWELEQLLRNYNNKQFIQRRGELLLQQNENGKSNAAPPFLVASGSPTALRFTQILTEDLQSLHVPANDGDALLVDNNVTGAASMG